MRVAAVMRRIVSMKTAMATVTTMQRTIAIVIMIF